ncbi:MAG TPA: GntR family transcriptional regulator [Pseudoflavonifractor sp.]|nr:GntR family transcriptional regulator [Pseudoflavonifractor sp.]
MEFTKLSAPTLKELFIREMEGMILSGQLAVGERLPSERELAEQMQVSRAVVNGGISDLARKGFLHVKPRAGVYVADYRRTGTPETIRSIMEYNGGRLRSEEIRSILEIKLIFDQLAVEQAIPGLTEEGLAALEGLLAELERAQSPQAAAEAAFAFYHELTLLGRNTLIPLIYQAFRVPNLSLWAQYARRYGNQAIYENAAGVFRAVRARDILGAKESIRAVLTALMEREGEK